MGRPMGLGKKPPAYSDPALRWLMLLSKAALADCVVDLLRTANESADDQVTEAQAVERLTAVLQLRGDKPPVTAEMRTDKRIRRIRADKVFKRALEIAEEPTP